MLFLLSLIELSSQLCYNQAMIFNKLGRKKFVNQYLLKKMIAFRRNSFIIEVIEEVNERIKAI